MSEATNTVGNSFFSFKRTVLAPGENKTFNVTGNYFLCTDAQGRFGIAFNDREFVPCQLGLGFEFEAGDYFTKLRLQNPSSDTAIWIEFFTASGRVIDNRLNAVKERAQSLLFASAPTKVVSKGITSLAAGGTLALTGIDTDPSLMRRSVLVTNLNAPSVAGYLELWTAGAGGKQAAAIFSGQPPFQLETSDALVIKNPSGLTIPCFAAELYYTLNLSGSATSGIPVALPLIG